MTIPELDSKCSHFEDCVQILYINLENMLKSKTLMIIVGMNVLLAFISLLQDKKLLTINF